MTKLFEQDWTEQDKREFLDTYLVEGVENLEEIVFIQEQLGFKGEFVNTVYRIYRECER